MSVAQGTRVSSGSWSRQPRPRFKRLAQEPLGGRRRLNLALGVGGVLAPSPDVYFKRRRPSTSGFSKISPLAIFRVVSTARSRNTGRDQIGEEVMRKSLPAVAVLGFLASAWSANAASLNIVALGAS